MKLKAMATVDLNNIDSEQRKIFNEEMKKKKWTKIKKLTTTWKASFEDSFTVESAETVANNDIWNATKKAKIDDWEAAVMIGSKEPHIF